MAEESKNGVYDRYDGFNDYSSAFETLVGPGDKDYKEPEEKQEKKSYRQHQKDNWKVTRHLLLLAFFHFIHGLIRTEKTSHKYWGIE